MAKRKILIDCDPGHDDAVALLFAARHLDLVGVTTVHGNNSLENPTRNALARQFYEEVLRPGADWLACQCESSGTDVLRHARWAYR